MVKTNLLNKKQIDKSRKIASNKLNLPLPESKPKKKTSPKTVKSSVPVFMASKGNSVNHVVMVSGKQKSFAIGKVHPIDLTKLDCIPKSMAGILIALVKAGIPDSLRLTYTSSHGGTIGLALKDKASFKGLLGYHGIFKGKPLFMLNNSGMLMNYASELIKSIAEKTVKGIMVNLNATSYAFFAYSHEKPERVIEYIKKVLKVKQ
jgi:hypothetical protein